MKRIAAPMIGGLVTSFLLELLVYPAIYKVWKTGDWSRTGVRRLGAVTKPGRGPHLQVQGRRIALAQVGQPCYKKSFAWYAGRPARNVRSREREEQPR